MKCIVDGFRTVGPLGLACLALIAAPPTAVRAQIVGPGVYAWGSNGSGQLGTGSSDEFTLTPGLVTALSGVNVAAVAEGGGHSLAVTSTGAVYACGYNMFGQLGNGNTTNSSAPVMVMGLSGVNVTAVVGGAAHSLALTSNGSVYAWGYNGDGELGNGNLTQQIAPVQVTGGGLSGVNVTAIAAGSLHSLALTSTGAVYAWGASQSGQLGNGSFSYSNMPVQVLGVGGVGTLSNISAVAAGESHSLAVTSTGAVYAWGFNFYGELGNGNTIFETTPVAVTGLSGVTVKEVAGGGHHSLALTSTGGVYAWGANDDGQLGNGTTTDSLTASFWCPSRPMGRRRSSQFRPATQAALPASRMVRYGRGGTALTGNTATARPRTA